MVRLILARHGETDWNAERRYQGQTDRPLNRAGRRQAVALAGTLVARQLHAVYASDLKRAQVTAQTIAAPHGLAVHADPRLREMSFGAWEGLTYAQVQALDPQALADWQADPLHTAPPGGESLSQVVARTQAWLDDLVRAHRDQTVLLVAHGGPLRVLLCLALGLPPEAHWRFQLDVAALSEINLYAESAMLTRLNDTHHLGVEGLTAGPNDAGRLTLILGGARSGKSTFAQQLAQQWGGERVLFVATAEGKDGEMRRRIDKHRQERPASWRTLEAPKRVGPAVLAQAQEARAILVDCVTLLVSNLLIDLQDAPAAEAEARVVAEIQALVDCVENVPAHLIVVSNEVGLGVVPPYPLGRLYRDLLGRANQILAQKADQVYWLAAGIATPLK